MSKLVEELVETVEVLIGEIDVPRANCSCHIAAPCNDCVDWGAVREEIEDAKALVVRAKTPPVRTRRANVNPPKFIYLQFYGDQEPFTDADPVSSGEVTWSVDPIHRHDVSYMLARHALASIDFWHHPDVGHAVLAATLAIGFLGGVLVASLS